MRTPVIAGNWKMYKTTRQSTEMIRSLAGLVQGVQGVEVVICPPFTALSAAVEAAKGSGIGVGAQDCYWEKEGAFTGEVAVPMIADLGCSHCLVGHSERRQFFGETDATVEKKIEAVLTNGLTCIACVGETLAEREAGQTFAVLERQVRGGLMRHLASPRLVIAYEPVWAIGTGKTATPVRPRQFGSCMGGVSSRTTSQPSCPSPTWTAASWAAPASTRPLSQRSSGFEGSATGRAPTRVGSR